MKKSFDFDGTLGELKIQELAKKHIEEGAEVYITTARFEHPAMRSINKDVWAVAERLGIPKDRVRFTNGNGKENFLTEFECHYDDCMLTLALIREHNKEIKLFHVDDFNTVRDFDDFDYKIKTTPAGLIIP